MPTYTPQPPEAIIDTRDENLLPFSPQWFEEIWSTLTDPSSLAEEILLGTILGGALTWLLKKLWNRFRTPSPRADIQDMGDSRVDINHADLATLMTLPGVGAKLAQRIIELREQEPFTTVDDIRKVGIPSKLFVGCLKDKIKV